MRPTGSSGHCSSDGRRATPEPEIERHSRFDSTEMPLGRGVGGLHGVVRCRSSVRRRRARPSDRVSTERRVGAAGSPASLTQGVQKRQRRWCRRSCTRRTSALVAIDIGESIGPGATSIHRPAPRRRGRALRRSVIAPLSLRSDVWRTLNESVYAPSGSAAAWSHHR